jgi:hypothetical protein
MIHKVDRIKEKALGFSLVNPVKWFYLLFPIFGRKAVNMPSNGRNEQTR